MPVLPAKHGKICEQLQMPGGARNAPGTVREMRSPTVNDSTAKKCAWCNKVFLPRDANNVTCSPYCSKRYNKKREQKAYYTPKRYTKECAVCGKEFTTNQPHHRICSDSCREEKKRINQYPAELSSGTRGAISELVACADLLKDGWHVFRAVSPACPFDLMAVRGHEQQRIEVRTGSRSYPDAPLQFSRTKRGEDFDLYAVVEPSGSITYISADADAQNQNTTPQKEEEPERTKGGATVRAANYLKNLAKREYGGALDVFEADELGGKKIEELSAGQVKTLIEGLKS